MATFVKGDIIVVPFPFTDLTKIKRRPALVIANLRGNDVILCQITSQNITDIYAISLTNDEFKTAWKERFNFLKILNKILRTFVNHISCQNGITSNQD